jgi:hypothetical protein
MDKSWQMKSQDRQKPQNQKNHNLGLFYDMTLLKF